MKDYYYFLGLREDASDDDVKKAYRKLSLKYHPDKNENDDFFAKRFMEIQEAYEMLGDREKRRIYDENLSHQRRSYRPALPPNVKSFSANKIRARRGEEVTIYWQTYNADIVKILPFGLERGFGERTFRINEFKDGKFQLLLHATNSLLNKTIARGITITEMAEHETMRAETKGEPAEATETKNPAGKRKPNPLYIVIAALFLVLALLLLAKSFFG